MRRRCRVRLCVPRGGGAPSGASVHAGSTRPASPTPRRRARRLRLPRTDAGPAAACAAGLRPPPIRPAAWEASVGGVRGFRSLRARAPRVAGLGFARTALPSICPLSPVFTFDLPRSDPITRICESSYRRHVREDQWPHSGSNRRFLQLLTRKNAQNDAKRRLEARSQSDAKALTVRNASCWAFSKFQGELGWER